MKAFSIHLPSKLSSGSGPYIIWDDTGKWHLLRRNGEENSIKQKFIHGKYFFFFDMENLSLFPENSLSDIGEGYRKIKMNILDSTIFGRSLVQLSLSLPCIKCRPQTLGFCSLSSWKEGIFKQYFNTESIKSR